MCTNKKSTSSADNRTSNDTMVTRRSVLAGAGAATLLASGLSGLPRAMADDFSERQRLRFPNLLDSYETKLVELTAMTGSTKFLGGVESTTYGFNQNYLGPTLRLSTGATKARIENTLDEYISVHWHGLLLPGAQDGGPHQPIASGGNWVPELDIAQAPSTAWYHTHIHENTAAQVYRGLAGAIQVTDGQDHQRGLPDTYGEDDLLLVLQDKRFDESGQMDYQPHMMDMMHGFVGDQILVNGQTGGLAIVPKGIVRLRLLNASNARIFSLFFEDQRPMHLIATDGGYLSSPVPLKQLRLSPGERVEVLVDFGNALPASLMSGEDPNQGPSGMMGRISRVIDAFWDRSFVVLPFSVDERLKSPIDRLPDQLGGEAPQLDGEGVVRRRVSLDMPMGPGMMHGGMTAGFAINGRPFDMERIDFQVAKGTVEHWTVESQMLAHPFHIHGAYFQVISENGQFPRPENQGWKDTVLVDRQVELLVRFNHTATEEKPFMFHCHILEHEDAGMMGQFTVT